jgi:transcriptional regulator with XRE-family HTH domain
VGLVKKNRKASILARNGKVWGDKERLRVFAQRLEEHMIEKGWSGAALAREASKHAPKGVEIGRHLISAYLRASNEPTQLNLGYIAKALGVKSEELLPPPLGDGESPQYATATTTIDGKTRLVVDAEVDAETALKVIRLVKGATHKPL